MKDQHLIENMLSVQAPEMDPVFQKKLRGRLVDLAEIQMRKRPSVFESFFLNMQRNSFAYFSILVVLVASLSMLLPKSITAPEVLAQVVDSYERTSDLYHEKIVHLRYDAGELVESSMDEVYYDSLGNYLSLVKNPKTEEVLTGRLEVVSEYGDVDAYESFNPNHDHLSVALAPAQQAWYETFRGEKIYCIEAVGDGLDMKSFSALSLAADDYSVYTLTGENGGAATREFENEPSLWDSLDEGKALAKDYVQQLIEAGSYDYVKLEENGVKYHVFKMAIAPYDEQEGEGGRVLWFYIEARTFRLARYDIHFKFDPERVEQNLVLESGYIQPETAPNVFDPSQYGDLQRTYFLSASLPFVPVSEGCYDWRGNPLERSILSEIPEPTLEAWHRFSASMEERPNSDLNQVLDAPDFPLDEVDATLPSHGSFSQGFHVHHLAWDFSSKQGEDNRVYAPLDATVLEVSEGLWNGGYGNSILLVHAVNGVEFQTYYANLDAIDVVVGQTLKQGDPIGTMGQTGRVVLSQDNPGVLLHFELRFENAKLDPAQLFEMD